MGFRACMFNSRRIYAWILYFDLLNYFLDERSTGDVEELTRDFMVVCYSLGKTTFFFFITHWGFVLIPLSWEFYQLHWGSFILQLLRGLLLCLGTTGESSYDTKICLGIWLMILTHEGVSRWFLSNSLRDVFLCFWPIMDAFEGFYVLWLLRAYFFTNGGQMVSLRCLALFWDFERAWNAN